MKQQQLEGYSFSAKHPWACEAVLPVVGLWGSQVLPLAAVLIVVFDASSFGNEAARALVELSSSV
jgi:hypothetical protein